MGKRTDPDMHLVLSDHHIPYQDKQVETLSLDFVAEHQPNTIHLLGDLVDFYTLSRFDKEPSRLSDLQSDLEAALAYLERLRIVSPKSRIIWSEGNHENRLKRYLWNKAPELSRLAQLQIPELFHLNDFNIEWVDSHHPYEVGKLLFTHGDLVRKWSGASAKGHHDKYGCCVIHGHTHRLGSFYHTTRAGSHGAWENGCLCTLTPEYMVSPDWQNGWSVVWFYGDFFHVEQVVVTNGSYVYHGGLRSIGTRPRVNTAG